MELIESEVGKLKSCGFAELNNRQIVEPTFNSDY